MKTYTVADLFYNRWEDLSPKDHATVFMLRQDLVATPPGQAYGIKLISILRILRRNKRLVDKINVAQAVDCYNDLSFLNQPWYYFPDLNFESAHTPEEKMARHSFDAFIYADNEFTSYLVTQDVNYLKRLVATLYQKNFDKENVEAIAKTLKLEDHELFLVFFTFGHVRNFVMQRCKRLLPRAPKSDDSEPMKPTGAMWLKLKHRLAETPAFQGYDTAGRANMYSTLDYLEDLHQLKENAKS